ncbi:hypothetical protein FRX31_013356 [Thalictrum thalictroides]|uniref:Plant thionin family protein n=1 Tax=Thalictrum thalictroides TaxID=46969 RepID=A0A7J6WI12_THATH|nr:hypothetical protein FRX31_013356 [Thalictrum thalictroides]
MGWNQNKKMVIMILFFMIYNMSMLSTDADDWDHNAIRPTFEQCIEVICMPKCLRLPGATESICRNSCDDGCSQASRGHLLLNHLH